ncbi:MAG TPA: 30S ribosomal protein THX, partial [Flavobacteriales bacterium]|nr:30S ribosomal protein THX [Flavobacteriales bacterium]
MGKGDKKTRKGKRFAGSYGITRPRKKDSPVIVKKKTTKKKEASTETEE